MKITLLSLSIIAGISQAALATSRVEILAGSFLMGCSKSDAKCEKDEGKVGGTKVEVPTFKLDTHEVTVAEYKKCMKAGKCEKPKDNQRNQYCNLNAKEREDHPINCVDWKDAVAYCTWAGGRLPYEAEWEKAARGKTDTAYPWGNEVNCSQAILDDGMTQGSVKGEPDGCGEDRSWSVGSRKANAYGLFDMQGNIGEWTANWYAKDALTTLYAKGDLKGPKQSKQRVVRGGSWDENSPNLRSSFRNVKPPVSGKTIYGSIGFRCAEDMPQPEVRK